MLTESLFAFRLYVKLHKNPVALLININDIAHHGHASFLEYVEVMRDPQDQVNFMRSQAVR